MYPASTSHKVGPSSSVQGAKLLKPSINPLKYHQKHQFINFKQFKVNRRAVLIRAKDENEQKTSGSGDQAQNQDDQDIDLDDKEQVEQVIEDMYLDAQIPGTMDSATNPRTKLGKAIKETVEEIQMYNDAEKELLDQASEVLKKLGISKEAIVPGEPINANELWEQAQQEEGVANNDKKDSGNNGSGKNDGA